MKPAQDTYTLAETGLLRLEHVYATAAGSAYVRELLSCIPSQPGWRALDVGCGTGHFTRELGRRLAPGEAIGIDSDPEVLALAEKLTGEAHGGVRYAAGNALQIPFGPASFDLVFMHLVLMHFRDPRLVLAESLRVLKPGGWLIAGELDGFLTGWYPDESVMHQLQGFFRYLEQRLGINFHRGREVFALLQELGLEAIDVRLVGDVYAGSPDSARVANVRALMENWTPLLKDHFGADESGIFSEQLLSYLGREDTFAYHAVCLGQGRVPTGSGIAG